MTDPQAVRFIGHVVEGQTDREVGLDRGIKADKEQLQRILKAHFRIMGPHENRLAVFGFADLEKGCVIRGFDEVACGVDQKEARLGACDLPADDHRRSKCCLCLGSRWLIGLDHFAQGAAHFACDLEHGGRLKDRRIAVLGRFAALVQQADDRLCCGEIARRHDHDGPLARNLPGVHFLDGRDVVHARICAGVGHKDQTGIQAHADAICHDLVAFVLIRAKSGLLLLHLQGHSHVLGRIAVTHARDRRRPAIVQPCRHADIARIGGNAVRDVKTHPAERWYICLRPGVACVLIHPVVHHQIARHIPRRIPHCARCGDEHMGVVLAHAMSGIQHVLGGQIRRRLIGGIGHVIEDLPGQGVQRIKVIRAARDLAEQLLHQWPCFGQGCAALEQPHGHVSALMAHHARLVLNLNRPTTGDLDLGLAGRKADQIDGVGVLVLKADLNLTADDINGPVFDHLAGP
mmetsp:Transcript_23678/g.42205  ORF Transcript_23678/g.42205 Transcript_23678/m.42205 type:complete len:460 (+) Transcript_23678:6819-8198(+)